MKSTDDGPEKAAELRRQAEGLYRGKATPSQEDLESLSPEATRQLLHELRVHQIELELQNEELRRAHVELGEGRARYFDLYDLAPVGYCTLSSLGLILEANLTAAGMLGVPRGALVRQPISRFILEADQGTYYLHRKQHLETGQPGSCELRMVKADGTAFWAHLVLAAQDRRGEPSFRLVFTDITMRIQAMERLRRSEHRHRTLFESDLIGILFADMDKIWEANDAFLAMVGYTREDLESGLIKWHEITPPEWSSADLKGLEELTSRGCCTPFEKEYLHKDGSRVAILIGAARLEADPLKWVCFVQNIGQRKQADAQIAEQLTELRRWHEGLLGREGRVLEVKQEVNELLARLGEPPRYPSAEGRS